MNKLLATSIILLTLFSVSALAQSAYGPSIEGDGYTISRSKVDRDITEGYIFEDSLIITNTRSGDLTVSFRVSDGIREVIDFESAGTIVSGQNSSEAYFTVTGSEVGTFTGTIQLTGDISEELQVSIHVTNESLTPDFFIGVKPAKRKFTFNDELDFTVDIRKVISEATIQNVSFNYTLQNNLNNQTAFLGGEVQDIIGSQQIRKKFTFPEELEEGLYTLQVNTFFRNTTTLTTAEFELAVPFWSIRLLGFLPMWLLAVLLGTGIAGIFAFVIVKRIIEKRKKYKMQLYVNTLPKKSERTFKLGKVAEKNIPAYYDAEAFTTHGVVAGATGGGKSITAQVIIEEALLKNISVIVFDPTAQWSGMLRKCEDKKMMSHYPKFGLKPTDARAFPGNVKQIINERQAIDINKYMNPGQIQIFSMNKLTPPQIDTFVAAVISSIFKGDPKEYPQLRTMLVFDEVHRLLPKFGGSGKGFLQIERACREFRKWGFGVMLVSQVLSDFVGEIKANINTEVQMRTRDEADLNRLKTKYGETFLQSLIKASVGVGMFVNPRYNKGKPYFIQFRPILHSTRRLSDEVLEKYNKYGEMIEDIEFQIEQLEAEKVDTFDLKMELKLVKDKLMTGNFTVVDIYLEGLNPRIEKQWQTLGKKPKKRELKLVDTSDIDAAINQAEKARKDFEEATKGSGDAKEESKPDDKAKEEKK